MRFYLNCNRYRTVFVLPPLVSFCAMIKENMKTGIYDFESRKLTVPVTGRSVAVARDRGESSPWIGALIAKVFKPARKTEVTVEQMRLQGL